MENKGEEKRSTPDIDFSQLFNEQVMQWLAGGSETPTDLRKLDDVFPKLNMFLILHQLNQLQRIPRLYEILSKFEEKLYSDEELTLLFNDEESKGKWLSGYNDIRKQISSITESARRFIVQNKDIVGDNSSLLDRALYEKIKAMNSENLKDFLEMVSIAERKGYQVLRDFIKQNK